MRCMLTCLPLHYGISAWALDRMLMYLELAALEPLDDILSSRLGSQAMCANLLPVQFN